MSGVSCPQKETHLFQSQLFLCCYFGFVFVIQVFEFEFVIPFASGSYQRRHSDDVWARDEGQTTASEDCREGISCFSIEESNLRPSWMLIGHAERLMLVAPWGFGAQLVFQRLSLMYTKSPWVLVEIHHHCSFGHSERSDLREKKDCRKLCHGVCEVATSFAQGFWQENESTHPCLGINSKMSLFTPDLQWLNISWFVNMQVIWLKLFAFDSSSTRLPVMAPMKSAMKAKKVAMKAMKGQKAMTKGALLGELATATEMKKSDITKVLNTLTEIGTEEVKKSGKFVLPGLCMIKTRQKAKGLGWDLWRVFR